LAEATGAINILPETLRTMQSILPEIPDAKAMRERPVHLAPIFVDQPSAAETATTHANIATNEEAPINHNAENPVKRVAFFAGCLMDTMFLKTNEATLKLLQLSGCEIFIPPDQACCGALHGHSGEAAGARELAKRNIEAFEKLDCDTIVTNAGGCGAYLIDYAHLLADDPEWSERAARFSSCIKDLSEVLLECGFFRKISPVIAQSSRDVSGLLPLAQRHAVGYCPAPPIASDRRHYLSRTERSRCLLRFGWYL